jgi:hypothetical protein
MIAGARQAFMGSGPALWPFREDRHEREYRLATELVFLTRSYAGGDDSKRPRHCMLPTQEANRTPQRSWAAA